MPLRRQSVATGLWTAGANFQQDNAGGTSVPAWQGQNGGDGCQGAW